MQVKSYQPKSALLRRYIELIYTLKCGESDEPTTYIAFPSVFAMPCLNRHSRREGDDENLTFSHSRPFPLQSTLICEYIDSSVVKYHGPADEIVIYFKPLGINAFLERPLKHYSVSRFVDFAPFDDYLRSAYAIFALDGDEARLEALESYWLSKYRGFEHPFLNSIVDEMLADPGAFSIAEAAGRHGISRTTLNKHFDLHIGTTPSQFRKIIRFRKAMTRHRQNILPENLTDISHGVDYFDQSHMVKDFKALTKYSPKQFFARLSTLEDGNINWLFLPAA